MNVDPSLIDRAIEDINDLIEIEEGDYRVVSMVLTDGEISGMVQYLGEKEEAEIQTQMSSILMHYFLYCRYLPKCSNDDGLQIKFTFSKVDEFWENQTLH